MTTRIISFSIKPKDLASNKLMDKIKTIAEDNDLNFSAIVLKALNEYMPTLEKRVRHER